MFVEYFFYPLTLILMRTIVICVSLTMNLIKVVFLNVEKKVPKILSKS